MDGAWISALSPSRLTELYLRQPQCHYISMISYYTPATNTSYLRRRRRKKVLVVFANIELRYYICSPTRYTPFLWLNIYSQYIWQLDMFRTYRYILRSVYKLCVAGLVMWRLCVARCVHTLGGCGTVKYIVNKYSAIKMLCILLDYKCNIARWYTVPTISNWTAYFRDSSFGTHENV